MAKDHLRSPEHRPGLSTWWLDLKAAPERGWAVSVIWQVLVGSGAGCGRRTAQNTKAFQPVSPVSDASSVNLMMPLGHKLVLYLAEKVREHGDFSCILLMKKTLYFFLFWKNLQGDFRGSQISEAPSSCFRLASAAFPGVCVLCLSGVSWLQFP